MTSMSQSLMLTVLCAHHATSGSGCALTQPTVLFHGKHIVRVVWQEDRTLGSPCIHSLNVHLSLTRNVHTPEERDQFFTKDPGIHKFDAKSVLCAICNTWVVVHPGTPGEVVEKWLQHRSTCQKVTVP